MLKRFSAAQKLVQSKSVPKVAVFRKFKGLNIKYRYRDPKRHLVTRNDVFWRKKPLTGVGWNPWTDRYKILHVWCRPGRNHACQFWWRSVKGFWCGEGSNYGFFYWLASSHL